MARQSRGKAERSEWFLVLGRDFAMGTVSMETVIGCVFLSFEGNLLCFVRARAHVRALMARKSCAVGMRNAILRNYLNY